MAVSTTDIDALPDWTLAQTLRAAKNARINILAGGTQRSINGRTLTMADLADINDLISVLEEEVANESSGAGGLHALARFGDVQ